MRKRRRLRRMVNTVTAGVLMLTLSACGSTTSGLRNIVTTEEAKNRETTKAEEIAPLWGETEEQEIFSLYTELDNDDLDGIESALDRYFKYVEAQEEFSLKSNGYGTYLISKYAKQNAVSLADKLAEKPMLNELDQSFMEFYPELIEMIDCINTIYEYADLNSYLDDDYAKAADFHQTLWKLHGNYKELAEKLHMDFSQYSTDYLNNILMQSKAEDDRIRLEAVAALLAAKSIDEEFRIQEINDKNLPEADIERLHPFG